MTGGGDGRKGQREKKPIAKTTSSRAFRSSF